MPVTYTIDVNERIIRTKCTGDVTFQEVIDHFHVLGQDPNWRVAGIRRFRIVVQL